MPAPLFGSPRPALRPLFMSPPLERHVAHHQVHQQSSPPPHSFLELSCSASHLQASASICITASICISCALWMCLLPTRRLPNRAALYLPTPHPSFIHRSTFVPSQQSHRLRSDTRYLHYLHLPSQAYLASTVHHPNSTSAQASISRHGWHPCAPLSFARCTWMDDQSCWRSSRLNCCCSTLAHQA